MRAISIRIASVLLAIFAAGLIITPVETSARNGGFAGSHAIGFHGGFPPRTVRPTGRPAFARTHGVTHFRHRRFGGAGAPWGAAWGYAPSNSGYYEPPAVVSDEQSDEEPSPPLSPRRGCSTQIYKVPSEGGGEVSIKVVRC